MFFTAVVHFQAIFRLQRRYLKRNYFIEERRIMRYLIKQKLISIADGFTIKDENSNDVYKVKGKVLSIGAKLTMFDMQGKEECFIQQKVLKLMPEYHISVDSKEVMVVKEKFALIKKKFNITGSAGEYRVEGNVIAKDFKIMKGDAVCATISKKLLALSDTYTVDIADTENNVLMLAVTVVMDMVCHSKK
jgi:uncharacterized protein YxjI